MAQQVKLSTPRMRVQRPDQDPVELQATNADLVLWDRTRGKHRWPKFDEAPFLWVTFLSWAAARRTGVIGAEVTYETWEASVLEVEALDDDPEGEEGRPTQPGPDPG
jgi:hypothetical protein